MALSRSTPRERPPAPLPLDHLVESARAHLDHQPGNALLRVTGDPPLTEGYHLHDGHPLERLLGLTAPPEWLAIGLHAKGRGYEVPDPHEGGPPGAGVSFAEGTGSAVPVTVTLLIDRTGQGRGLLRDGDQVRRLTGLPDGVVGDACRRALGLPTAPPPDSTVGLWLHLWLDRVVDAAEAATRRRSRSGPPLSWDATARLHPAPGMGVVPAPEEVVEVTHEMAGTWPWSRLRLEPEVVDTGRPPLERAIAVWMDDGMYARWVRSELVELPVLLAAARRFLDPRALERVSRSFALCGHPLPTGEPVR
jgi:hypothetical protein